MPYYDIKDADTGETIAEGVYIPYDSYNWEESEFSKKLSKIVIFILKFLFLILPQICIIVLYPFLLIKEIKNETFNFIENVLANPFVYIWLVFLIFTIVKVIDKIRLMIKTKNGKREESIVDDDEKHSKSELRFFMNVIKYIRYLYIGAISLILLWSIMPFLPELDIVYVSVLSVGGSYLYLISLLFYFLDSIINSDKKEGYIKQAIKDTLTIFFGFIILATIVASIVMLFSKSDNVLLPVVLLSLNIPFVKLNTKSTQ